MATIESETIARAMLVFEPLDRPRQGELLRRAVDALGTFHGAVFTGEDELSQSFIAGGETPRDRTVMLRHPWLDENSAEEEGRIKLSVMPDGPAAPTYLFMSISVGSGEEAPAQQWSVGLELLPRFIEATSPLAAFFNLKDVDDESYRMFPPMAGILRSQFPDALPPVFYIDEAKLGDSPRMSWLATLPAQRFVALPRGKLIIAIASPRNKASAEFIAALEAAPSGPICFIPPQLPS